MTVAVVFPSARQSAEAQACVDAWRARGYRVAVQRDKGSLAADLCLVRYPYVGYAASINQLAKLVLQRADVQIVVAAGDDVWPDPDRRPEDLEVEFIEHFGGTYGVMQPAGHSDWSNVALEVAWSPWLGREWCERAYGGKGPLWPGYFHFWVDHELQKVAEKEGVFWPRADVCQRHDTWKRRVPRLPRPPHLHEANRRHGEDRDLFFEREAQGFPT